MTSALRWSSCTSLASASTIGVSWAVVLRPVQTMEQFSTVQHLESIFNSFCLKQARLERASAGTRNESMRLPSQEMRATGQFANLGRVWFMQWPGRLGKCPNQRQRTAHKERREGGFSFSPFVSRLVSRLASLVQSFASSCPAHKALTFRPTPWMGTVSNGRKQRRSHRKSKPKANWSTTEKFDFAQNYCERGACVLRF